MTYSRTLLVILLILLGGCRARYSFNGGSVPADANTFSVDYFSVRAPLAEPDYGQKLSEQLRDLLLTQTRLSLSTSQGDLHYEGVVSRYDILPVAASGDEVSTRNRLSIELKVSFFNLLDPDKDKTLTLRQFEDFESTEEFIDVQEDLLIEINEKILQDIFDQTLGDW